MKLTDRLKQIEQFALDHKPPSEVRRHFDFLLEHLEMDDSLIERMATKDADHAKMIANLKDESEKLRQENAVLQSKPQMHNDQWKKQLRERAHKLWHGKDLDYTA